LVRARASRVAIRRAAASKKCPEPQAGSTTVTDSRALATSSASASMRFRKGSRALSSNACTRLSGVK
jgi:hypothetical protein